MSTAWLRLRTVFLCAFLQFGLMSGIPMRPDEIARLMKWLAAPRVEQESPDEAARGDDLQTGKRP